MISGERLVYRFDLGEGIDVSRGTELVMQLGDGIHPVVARHIDTQSEFSSMTAETISCLPEQATVTREPHRLSVTVGNVNAAVTFNPTVEQFIPEDVVHISLPPDEQRSRRWRRRRRFPREDIKQHLESDTNAPGVRCPLGLRHTMDFSVDCRAVAASLKLKSEHWISFKRINPAYRLSYERQLGGR
jgi:hypothetical protein